MMTFGGSFYHVWVIWKINSHIQFMSYFCCTVSCCNPYYKDITQRREFWPTKNSSIPFSTFWTGLKSSWFKSSVSVFFFSFFACASTCRKERGLEYVCPDSFICPGVEITDGPLSQYLADVLLRQDLMLCTDIFVRFNWNNSFQI